MLDGLLCGSEQTIGTRRSRQPKPVRKLLRSFEDSGWVPRSKTDTWPAEFDGPDVALDDLLKLHDALKSGALGEGFTREHADHLVVTHLAAALGLED